MTEGVISQESAMEKGMVSVTTPFSPGEMWMLPNFLADLRRGNILCAIVATPAGVEVWRTISGMTFADSEEGESV